MDSLSVVFPIGPLRSLARKPVRRPALCLRRSLLPPSLSLSLSLSLVASLLVASSIPAASYLLSLPRLHRVVLSPSSSRLANVHVPPSSSSRWLLVSTLHFSVYAANCTATASICEGRARSRQAFLPVARCGA